MRTKGGNSIAGQTINLERLQRPDGSMGAGQGLVGPLQGERVRLPVLVEAHLLGVEGVDLGVRAPDRLPHARRQLLLLEHERLDLGALPLGRVQLRHELGHRHVLSIDSFGALSTVKRASRPASGPRPARSSGSRQGDA